MVIEEVGVCYSVRPTVLTRTANGYTLPSRLQEGSLPPTQDKGAYNLRHSPLECVGLSIGPSVIHAMNTCKAFRRLCS